MSRQDAHPQATRIVFANMKLGVSSLCVAIATAAPLVSRGNVTTCDTCYRPKEPCAVISATVKQFYAVDSSKCMTFQRS